MILNKDSIAETDLLNRKPFADIIAKGIVESFENGTESFVLGLNGKWGSGKSTLLSFMKNSLKRELGQNKYKLIDFNPWKFSGREELLQMFLNTLISEIGKDKGRIQKALGSFGRGLALLEGIKYIDPTTGHVQQVLKKIVDMFSQPKSVSVLKNAIDKLLVKEKVRLIVFVDDLDRLASTEVVEMFQIIKLSASFKNTLFIVSFDKDMVSEALTHHLNVDGDRYLEKIIQVDYRIPDLQDEVISRVFFSTLDEFEKQFQIDCGKQEIETIWIVNRLRYYFSTLRDIYRYFNALQLRLPALKSEVYIPDFMVIEAIRLFDYSAYNLIQQNYKKSKQFGPKTISKSFDSEIKDENTKYLVNHLFQAEGKNSALRVRDLSFFDRYFALSIDISEIDELTFKLFRASPEQRDYIISESLRNGKFHSLLARIRKELVFDLSIFKNLLTIPAEYEKSLVEQRNMYFDIVISMLTENDFVDAFSALYDELKMDDQFFNPGKYLVLSFFSDSNKYERSTIDSRDFVVIKSYEKRLNPRLSHLLEKFRNEHLVFNLGVHKSHFLHKQFLIDTARLYPDAYHQLLTQYFKTEANLLSFLRLFLYPDKNNFDKNINKTILPIQLAGFFEEELAKIQPSGLLFEDRRYFDFFYDVKDRIAAFKQ